jgi:hypothetical protein
MSASHLPGGSGTVHLFLGTTMSVKVGERETGGALTLIEQECPPGPARLTEVAARHGHQIIARLTGAGPRQSPIEENTP